jgi:myo-inositol 2-dehydrogenase/D-chiro-inositol 1-dehydrogenase
VYATAAAHDPAIKAINDHDTVVINMTFASGAFGVIDLSRHGTYGYDQRLEVSRRILQKCLHAFLQFM